MPYPGYTFTNRFFAVDGHRMHYIDEGPPDGEPVVMVHGNPTWSFYFRGLIGDLCPRYRTVVPDHVGMGLSSTPPPNAYPYTLAARIDNLEALLEARNVTRDITLIVHDWGDRLVLATPAVTRTGSSGWSS